MPVFIYLHGFRSSPLSFKAQLTHAYMQAQGIPFMCPALPPSPKASVELVRGLMKPYPAKTVTLIGSSLGGYYANWLAEQSGCRAVLLNPVVNPWMTRPIMAENPDGLERVAWQADLEKYGAELAALKIEAISLPTRYLLIGATGDELLDYRLMQAHYAGARQLIVQGSNHSLPEYAEHLDLIRVFGCENHEINER